MTKLAFNTQRLAENANEAYTQAMFDIARAEGFTIAQDGEGNDVGIVGKVEGRDAPQNQQTLRYAEPEEAEDLKWELVAPEEVSLLKRRFATSPDQRPAFINRGMGVTER